MRLFRDFASPLQLVPHDLHFFYKFLNIFAFADYFGFGKQVERDFYKNPRARRADFLQHVNEFVIVKFIDSRLDNLSYNLHNGIFAVVAYLNFHIRLFILRCVPKQASRSRYMCKPHCLFADTEEPVYPCNSPFFVNKSLLYSP